MIEKYDRETHEAWVAKLKRMFYDAKITDSYRGTNTTIEVSVKNAIGCEITLTLNFGKPDDCKEHGSVLVIYGTLNDIRRFYAHSSDSWDCAIKEFESVVRNIDDFIVSALQTMLHNLRYSC